ncbi:MAG: 2-C-methyl-D-erythritol 2,4-cyclodiphosphate synthase [Solirubrobacterales bacterium]
MSVRVGVGYDAHRFESGRRLVLGGVEIPHERGLGGHSDADVLIHAAIDAILGAAGEGDLGTLFPPDEEQWRDADSLDLLTVALARVPGRVMNLDATLICEEPPIDPHRAEMQRNIGEALSAGVSVKATTNERMGWIGRGEGIACVAVVLLDLE